MNINDLTPVEKYKGVYIKRDDFFKLGLVTGGKLRQALCLIGKNLDTIKNKHNSTVVCPCSNPSPQSAIISEVCKFYNLKCKIVTFKTLKPNINLSIAQTNGAELYGTRVGWNSVINSKAKTLSGFNIKMGFADKDIIDANIRQVENIPDVLDNLVIPVGSGFNAISILKGLRRYDKKVLHILLVYVGKNPSVTLETYLKGCQEHSLIPYSSQYSTPLKKYPLFDEIYEAKVWDWMIKNLDLKNKKTLFWIVGKRNTTFEPVELNWIEI